jgi:cytochrome b6-f complex iron-sulfur subunit
MDGTLDLTRRTVLIGAGAGGTALLLAACSGSSDDADDPTVTDSATTSSPAETTSAPESTVAPTTAAPTTAAPPVTGTTIAALSAVPVGSGILTKDKDGQPVIVAQPTAGTAVAFSAICTHQQCTVNAPAGDNITCPCHGSMFQTSTGKVTNPPANQALRSVAVTVVDGNVVQA